MGRSGGTGHGSASPRRRAEAKPPEKIADEAPAAPPAEVDQIEQERCDLCNGVEDSTDANGVSRGLIIDGADVGFADRVRAHARCMDDAANVERADAAAQADPPPSPARAPEGEGAPVHDLPAEDDPGPGHGRSGGEEPISQRVTSPTAHEPPVLPPPTIDGAPPGSVLDGTQLANVGLGGVESIPFAAARATYIAVRERIAAAEYAAQQARAELAGVEGDLCRSMRASRMLFEYCGKTWRTRARPKTDAKARDALMLSEAKP